MITVPACKVCNADKARDDIYLRDMLVLDKSTDGSPTAHELQQGKVGRSFEANKSEYLNSVVPNIRFEPAYSPSGLFLGLLPVVPIDQDRLTKIFSRIIRGLHYKQVRARIPDDYIFTVARPDPIDVQQAIKQIQSWDGRNAWQLQNDLFGCLGIHAAEDPFITRWVLWFYNSVFFGIETNPPPDKLAALEEAIASGKYLTPSA